MNPFYSLALGSPAYQFRDIRTVTVACTMIVVVTGVTLPIELKRALFPVLSAGIRGHLRRRHLSERDVHADFGLWRKTRRAARRRRYRPAP